MNICTGTHLLIAVHILTQFFDIYKSRDERRRLQLLHEHFTRIRKEMLAQDAIQVIVLHVLCM